MTHGKPRRTFDWMTRQQRQQSRSILPRVCGVRSCAGFASHFILIETKTGPQYHPRCDSHFEQEQNTQ